MQLYQWAMDRLYAAGDFLGDVYNSVFDKSTSPIVVAATAATLALVASGCSFESPKPVYIGQQQSQQQSAGRVAKRHGPADLMQYRDIRDFFESGGTSQLRSGVQAKVHLRDKDSCLNFRYEEGLDKPKYGCLPEGTVVDVEAAWPNPVVKDGYRWWLTRPVNSKHKGKLGFAAGNWLQHHSSNPREMKVQFGFLEDMDGDGDKDAIVVAGNVTGSYSQKAQHPNSVFVFTNDQGRFHYMSEDPIGTIDSLDLFKVGDKNYALIIDTHEGIPNVADGKSVNMLECDHKACFMSGWAAAGPVIRKDLDSDGTQEAVFVNGFGGYWDHQIEPTVVKVGKGRDDALVSKVDQITRARLGKY